MLVINWLLAFLALHSPTKGISQEAKNQHVVDHMLVHFGIE